jgi:regulator of sirC expression with transglutaminase-like and TPR domain
MWSSIDVNRQEFEEMVRLPDAEIDLAAASLMVAREEYPLMDVASYLRKLDRMGDEVRDLIGAERHPSTVAAGLVRYLFREQGFEGAEEEYFDPRASYLNDVLDRRKGIPISLSIVYMEVARRAGFHVDGVGLPGHFIVKHPQPGGDLFVDPFNQGAMLSKEDCACKVKEIYDGAVAFQPYMLGAVTKRQILSRAIHNLKTVYAAARKREAALAMTDLLLIITPWDLEELRDRGMLRYRVGDSAGAVADLETYLEYSSGAGDADHVRSSVRAIRRTLRGGSGISWT